MDSIVSVGGCTDVAFVESICEMHYSMHGVDADSCYGYVVVWT